ncbi:MAG: ubiquinol-cytochrome c reductase iron-sulfur subunit [Thermoflexus sp.]|nr:ubiquinol-cytochrome c reductase iron-sulfur subunit [Thermoflexus sp.]
MAEAQAISSTATPGVSRREFLTYVWAASMALFMLEIGAVSVLFALPRFKVGEFGGIFPFGRAGEVLPKVGEDPKEFPEAKIWLVNTEKGILAIYKVCTHLGCLYKWVPSNFRFECPCHGSKFQLDGTYIEGPAPRDLDRFVIYLKDSTGRVVAQTDSQGNPLPVSDPNLLIEVDTGNKIEGKPAQKPRA